MKPVLSRAEMRAFDARAINQYRVPGLVLMENAGRGATDVISGDLVRGAIRGLHVVVVCGTGNNGGDGFVIARHLALRGAIVSVFCTGIAAQIKGDARVHHDAYLGIGGAVRALATDVDVAAFRDVIATASVVVDAIFGTGLSRAIEGRTTLVLNAMSAARCVKVAVDIPSGLDADTGAELGVCFHADATVTFAHYKLGLLTPRGARLAGAIHVADIGVPASLDGAIPTSAELVERSDVAAHFKPRAVDVHKHGNGHVGVFGGSNGKVGAPYMVARAALRSGAGVVTNASWPDSIDVLQARVVEEMTTKLSRDDVAASVEASLKGRRAVVAGPGLGLDDDARVAIETLLAKWKGPVVYDADALTLFAGKPESFAASQTPAVLTPHSGELARLLGITSDEVEADRYASARLLAKRANATVVLKGASTLIANASGRVVVNASGGPVLATAGSGDTLAGILGALLCTMAPFDAAYSAVYLHGVAGEAWSKLHGDRGLLASEIADHVPGAIADLAGTRR